VNSKLQKDISAQVVLKPSHLISISPDKIANEFQQAGFSVGPLLANSFSITARKGLFEHFLNVSLEVTPKGEVHVSGKSGPARFELPLGRLNPSIAEGIQSIVFTPMPDFGPGGDF
jgi:hypothetical protein